MESKTYLKNLDSPAKKLRFYLPAVKKYKPGEALNYLYYIPNKAARVLYSALKSAISNAKITLKTQEDLLKFKLLTVEQGRKLKRFKPGGRGTVRPILRKFSHIKIILEAEKPLENKPKVESLNVKSKVKIQKSKIQVKNKK